MKIEFAGLFHKLSKLVMPPTGIGGLQITNSSIRFMEFTRDRKTHGLAVKSASLRLPPGIVESGRIKDQPNFVMALRNLRAQVVPKGGKMVNVVLTIPAGDVYVEAFNLPALEDKNISEAANLNMQVISPNPIERSYYSWMVVGDASAGYSQLEVLGAFASKEVVDEFTAALEEAGFGIAAIEFSSLSLKRVLTAAAIVKKEFPYLLVKITQEGLIFIIIRNNNLYFNYFHSWDKVVEESGVVTLEQINSIVATESQRVMNFYSSHYGGQIKNILLITSVFADEIMAFLEVRYPGFEKTLLRSDKENLHGVRGAALRGAMTYAEEDEINLMGPDVVNAFWRDKINRFVGFWRNIVLTAAVFVLAVFGLADFSIRAQAEIIRIANMTNLREPATTELVEVQKTAKNFNVLVAALLKVRASAKDASPLIQTINAAAGANISVVRLSLRSADLSGTIDGLASSQDAIISFKNRLIAVSGIADADLPLSSIINQPSGKWSFVISFKIKP
ncbi:MAG: hypothetical protein A3B23_03615 [Candidatus Colwellbacteria bacterium RIFCSPLOWO2_01_FULL_48_10]|uniref:SHS2 domain-containing protein n=1 Tax=Candidatus Colwellbacteria bacterium RIFCSPLOWO2_01_FULL_48_10 TaxID=1797690 RepID=A0A1G1Z5Q0_9BACT|nr:MAG: hypothetical protein A3B23_03615 [Candidatus Colwellbacteria bacterium RIFCSPLOWO2_01_FULL_48_10]